MHAGPNSQKRKYDGTQILGNSPDLVTKRQIGPFLSHKKKIHQQLSLSQLPELSASSQLSAQAYPSLSFSLRTTKPLVIDKIRDANHHHHIAPELANRARVAGFY